MRLVGVSAAAVLVLVLPGVVQPRRHRGPQHRSSLDPDPSGVARRRIHHRHRGGRLDPRTAERFRDVSFSTTLGSFVGGTSARDTTLVVPADSSGRAVTTLRSSTTAGTAVVTAEIRDGTTVKVTRSIDVPFEQVPASNVLSINLGSLEAPADGATVTNIVARIASDVVPTERTVTFTTTAGSLGASNVRSVDVRASTDDLASVGLISPREVGRAIVTATLNGVSVRAGVEFSAAMPDSATLSVSGSFRIAAAFTTKVMLQMELFQGRGHGDPGGGGHVHRHRRQHRP